MTGKVRFITKSFIIHPQAVKAQEAAECAGEQGQFWQMGHLLFERQSDWFSQTDLPTAMKEYAGELGLDQASFGACLDEGKYAAKVQADYQEGRQAGAQGTPWLIINGVGGWGTEPYATLSQKIDYYLAGGKAPTLTLEADSPQSRGKGEAPMVITEFSDFQCPTCASVALEVVPELVKKYVDTGKARFVQRNLVLGTYPNSQKEAEAAVCAGRQGKYWEMSEKLFAAKEEVGAASDPVPLLKGYATDLELDTATFDRCLDESEAAADVAADGMAAQIFSVSATPSFFADDAQIYLLSTDVLFYQIEYVAKFGYLPDIEPQAGDFHAQYAGNTMQAAMAVFLDLASPDAAKYATEVYPQIKTQYIDAGSLIYIFHPWAGDKNSLSYQAAVAAECAGEQDKFWEMQAKLFADQASWTVAKTPRDSFTGYADGLALDRAKFETCLDGDWAALRALAGSFVGNLYSVTSAQTYLFGGGSSLTGAPTFDQVKAIVDEAIKQ